MGDALTLWPFAQAPEAYQALSDAGGDEDWLMLCPTALLEADWPMVVERALNPPPDGPGRHYVESWGWAERHRVDGGVVVIVSH